MIKQTIITMKEKIKILMLIKKKENVLLIKVY